MYLKKVLNQPNLVGTVLIALMVCSGFVYAFAFDGFNVETVTGGEVEAWLAKAGASSSSSPSYTCNNDDCKATNGNKDEMWANCPARKKKNKENCTGCSKITSYCSTNPMCDKSHHGKCRDKAGCPYAPQRGGCSNAKNSKTGKTQTTCPKKKCKGI